MVARLFCSRSYPALAPGAAPCDSARSHSLPSIARGSHARGWPRAKQDRDRGECPRPPELVDRDRGESHDSSPPTPPYIRVRIRRFDRLSWLGTATVTRPSDLSEAFDRAMASGGLLLSRQGPRGLPAACAA